MPEVDLSEFEGQKILNIDGEPTISVMNTGGYISLEQVNGDSELAIVNSARVSFANRSRFHNSSCPATALAKDEQGDCDCDDFSLGSTLSGQDVGLLKFLMRERHHSPLEHTFLRFRIRGPLYVFYEWHRHRIASYNEESARYTKMRGDFVSFLPDEIRTQAGKPGAYEFETLDESWKREEAKEKIDLAQHFCYRTYLELLELGVAKEQARVVLPVGLMKEQVWSVNLRGFMNFLSLRMDKNAQREIRAYAHAAYKLALAEFPNTLKAFEGNGWT